MNRPLRIGFVGAGANTREKHIPGFRALPGVELAAVVNRTRASSERVARESGISRVAEDWRALVEAPDIDAICIGTWPYLHAEVAVAALRAGKHVLTEARMAATVAEAEAMEAALTDARRTYPGIVAQVVPSPVTLSWDAVVRDLLAEGVLGRLHQVEIAHLHGAYADPGAPIAWRQRREWNGVNTLTLGIYYEAVQRWLGEDASVLKAEAGIVTPERVDAATGARVAVDVPDWVKVNGVFFGGAVLRAEFSGVETKSPRNEIALHGELRGIRLDLTAGKLWLQAAKHEERELEIAPEKHGAWRVEADFVESIRKGTPVRLTDFATGVRYMRFTEAAWRAWQKE
ncbi:MAG: oxidoreductase [Rariglobus sp.]|jgi:predicted dehydrogenase|nr:oxidoreductase [Rariglobus sp.]